MPSDKIDANKKLPASTAQSHHINPEKSIAETDCVDKADNSAAVVVSDQSIDDTITFDGASSIEASTITSEITFMDAPRALLANVFNNIKSARSNNKPR